MFLLPQPNITREEASALKELRDDRSWIILTLENGVAIEVQDKWDYSNKRQDLLGQSGTYRTLAVDPTNKFSNILWTIKLEKE